MKELCIMVFEILADSKEENVTNFCIARIMYIYESFHKLPGNRKTVNITEICPPSPYNSFTFNYTELVFVTDNKDMRFLRLLVIRFS